MTTSIATSNVSAVSFSFLTLPLPNYEKPWDYDDPLTPPEFKKILHLTKDLVEKNNSKL